MDDQPSTGSANDADRTGCDLSGQCDRYSWHHRSDDARSFVPCGADDDARSKNPDCSGRPLSVEEDRDSRGQASNRASRTIADERDRDACTGDKRPHPACCSVPRKSDSDCRG